LKRSLRITGKKNTMLTILLYGYERTLHFKRAEGRQNFTALLKEKSLFLRGSFILVIALICQRNLKIHRLFWFIECKD
ncbi:MAG: hypothetical protein WAZ60_00180, partial [Desulfosalsimonadaceae bacterium]